MHSNSETLILFPVDATSTTGKLDLTCPCGVSTKWELRVGLDTSKQRDPKLVINPVQSSSEGDWKCKCMDTERQYVFRVKVCSLHYEDCRRINNDWVKTWTNSCTGARVEEPCERITNPPQRESTKTQDKETEGSADAQAREDEQNEECLNCGYCRENPLACAAFGCFASMLSVVVALFINKSLKWRRQVKELRTGTLDTQITGTQSFARNNPPLTLDYDHAVQMEDHFSSLRPSSATSVTDVMHLQNLRDNASLGRIRSAEVSSTDNIVCVEFVKKNSWASTEWGNTGRYENTGTFQETALEEEEEIDEENVLPDEERAEEAAQDARRHKNGTMFDKYYEQNVDKWSITEEIEI